MTGDICTRSSQAARRCRRCQKSAAVWASISGAHRQIKSANFADLASGLKRLRSAPRAASRPIAADVQASGLPQAAARGTLNALAVEAFNDLLKKQGKRQNVENPLLD